VYIEHGSPKAPPSPSAAAVSARRASGGYSTSNSTEGSGHLAERLARLEAEHRAEDERLERLRAERRAEEDELAHQLEEARASEEEACRHSEGRKLPLHPIVTEETIKTASFYTGVAAAAASSASLTRSQFVQTPRQRVPTEKMERMGIEMSPDVLESRQGGGDGKETETERAAEAAVKTQTDHSVLASAQPTGTFLLPLDETRHDLQPALGATRSPNPKSEGGDKEGHRRLYSVEDPVKTGEARQLYRGYVTNLQTRLFNLTQDRVTGREERGVEKLPSSRHVEQVREIPEDQPDQALRPLLWPPHEVAQYVLGLREFGERAREYADVMIREEINGQTFLDLSDTDLRELKVPMGHRKVLLSRIDLLKHSA